jgi:hypothetical protein
MLEHALNAPETSARKHRRLWRIGDGSVRCRQRYHARLALGLRGQPSSREREEEGEGRSEAYREPTHGKQSVGRRTAGRHDDVSFSMEQVDPRATVDRERRY